MEDKLIEEKNKIKLFDAAEAMLNGLIEARNLLAQRGVLKQYPDLWDVLSNPIDKATK